MPISTKTKTSLITPELQRQIANNGRIEIGEGATPQKEEEPAATVTASIEQAVPTDSAPKSKYNDVANLHFSKGKKAEFKAFFSSHEVSLVQGVENAVTYIMKEVKAGRLRVSRNGIESVGE